METNMADVSSGTPESVALDLLEKVAAVERKVFYSDQNAADRKWILDTYAECVTAVRAPNTRFQP
jgi:hypothetical protein